MKFDPDQVARALRKSWSLASARQWTAENPAAGQCNVTALVVHDLFGGELLKTSLPEGDHFYNRIDGCRYDCHGQSVHSTGHLFRPACNAGRC
jgi:hypothetical protein